MPNEDMTLPDPRLASSGVVDFNQEVHLMPNEEKKVSDWEERFEEEFDDGENFWKTLHRNDEGTDDGMVLPSEVKSFIASVREEAYAEGFAKGVEAARKFVDKYLTPHGYISDDPKIERICQDEKITCREQIFAALNELTDKS